MNVIICHRVRDKNIRRNMWGLVGAEDVIGIRTRQVKHLQTVLVLVMLHCSTQSFNTLVLVITEHFS